MENIINLKGKKGVYVIEHIKSKNKYIGSSKNIYTRLHEHRNSLINQKHENIILSNAVNKYGINNFICYCIEEVDLDKNLTEREQFWIDHLNPKYNIIKKVERNILPKESRLKISKTLKEGYANGRIQITKSTPVDLYDLNCNFIKSFLTIKDCSKYLNLSGSTIFRHLKGEYNRVKKKYIIVYKDKKPKKYIEQKVKGVEIELKFKDGSIKKFISFAEAARYIGCYSSALNRAYRTNKVYKGIIITCLT